MKPSRRVALFSSLLGILLFSAGCGIDFRPATLTPTPNNTSLPTQSYTPSQTPIPPKATNIGIDGQPEDWVGKEQLVTDPIGDSVAGYMDLGAGYAFVNQDAIYLMLEVADPGARFAAINLTYIVDGRPLRVTWQPVRRNMVVADWRASPVDQIQFTANSTVAFGTVLEVRFDLEDAKNPKSVEEITVMIMADVDGRWLTVDSCQFQAVPALYEMDPPRVSSNEDKYRNARFWELPMPYVGQPLIESLVGNDSYLARSEDGTVYLQNAGAKNQIRILDPQKKEIRPVLDLPTYARLGIVTGGPANSVYLSVETQVWQIFPDGTHAIIGTLPGAKIRFFTPDGRFFAISRDQSTLLEWWPDGSERTIAKGFQALWDVVAKRDGTLFLYDALPGIVIQLKANGERKTLVLHGSPGEPSALGLDAEENLYANFGNNLFTRINPLTGQQTRLYSISNPCAWNLGDFVISDSGTVILTGDQIVSADLKANTNEILIFSPTATFAADAGPDGALYIGVSACGNQPTQVLRIADDGTLSVYVDGLEGAIDSIAFAPDGTLYVATRQKLTNKLFYLSPSSKTPVEIPGAPQGDPLWIAVHPLRNTLFVARPRGMPILEFNPEGRVAEYPFPFEDSINNVRIDFSGDGTLYAFIDGLAHSRVDSIGRWILRLNLEDSKSEVVVSIPWTGMGQTMSAFAADSKGIVWLYVNPDSILYRINPDGTHEEFAVSLPVDASALAVDDQGDIYFTSAGGIFRIFREV